MEPVLNKKEAALVAKAWQPITTDLEGNGSKFFKALFRERPEIRQQYFAHWPDENVDDSKYNDHGIMFMRDVDLLVKCAGESKRQGDLIEKVRTITRMHEPKVIRTEAYEIANQVLLNFLKEALGDDLNKEAEAAFKKLLDTMVTLIGKELDVIDNE